MDNDRNKEQVKEERVDQQVEAKPAEADSAKKEKAASKKTRRTNWLRWTETFIGQLVVVLVHIALALIVAIDLWHFVASKFN